MAKYKIGDKVRVRDDLKYEDWYYMSTSNETQWRMKKWLKKLVRLLP